MAAVMEAELEKSPGLNSAESSDDDAVDVDEHLRAEEHMLHKQRLQAEAAAREQDPPPAPVNNGHAAAKLMELVGKTDLYSSFLADQFQEVVDQTLRDAGAYGQEDGQPAAKKARTKKGAVASSSATQRLLPLIRAELRDYQLKGVAWLISLYKNGVNGILADEMGLGKTLQTIGFISYLWQHCKDKSGKYMVVGPLSTLSNWVAEFQRFAPGIPVLLYHGSVQEREQLRRQHMQTNGTQQMPVICTSYEIVMSDRRHLERHVWKLVVVDEGHRLKNFDCRLLREMRQLTMESRLLLTGTPLQNNLKELWSLLSFCMPNVFHDAQQFLDWFDIRTPAAAIPDGVTMPQPGQQQPAAAAAPKRRGRPSKKAKAEAEAAAAAAKAEKETGEQEGKTSEEEQEQEEGSSGGKESSAKPSEQAQAQAGGKGQEQQQQEAGGSGRGAEQAAAGVGAGALASTSAPASAAPIDFDMVSRLHKILKPFVLRRVKADVNIGVPPKQETVLYAEMTEEQRRLTRGLIDGSLKEELARESRGRGLNNLIMQLRKVCNHPDLITGATSDSHMYPSADELVAACGKLALLERLLTRLRAGGHRVLIFSQMTSMMSVLEAYLEDRGIPAARLDGSVAWQQRKQDIADFQSGGGKDVFLLSTRAGGLGINLTAADTVIIYDSDWNPHQDSQAMDRCHRIGQTRPVLVFRLATANSVECRMLARAESKKALERIVIKKGAFKDVEQAAVSSAEELAALLNPDRASDDLAQSGVVSDAVLEQLLDRSHLAAAHEASQQQVQGGAAAAAAAGGDGGAAKKAGGKGGKGGKAAAEKPAAMAVGPDGTPVLPYPAVGKGYEVVVDGPRRAVGVLDTIDDE
ncbi:hypothetical protein HYH02_011155 [Chlamydomonas schloesseri]|uniref:SNF2 super family n=1 Tax=Chlamydomonas schloesseri TaxID=2026947 RepID=A0A835THF3_9CHLO|nr:hypothetical protein HYH02_011155 [Chlamydomonas schloesseri]|eukprot:KAG2437780.1 hypothetical protein HYH02_011155 [Chlamydomonas schloesseri]